MAAFSTDGSTGTRSLGRSVAEGCEAVGEEPVADELHRLRRENTHLKLENDILKKAAVILGTRPLQGGAR